MKQPKHRKKVLPKRLKNKYNYPGQALYQETFPPLSAVVSARRLLIVTIMVIVIITTPPGMVESARFRVCILSVGYVPIYDTGKESLSFRKVKKLIF